MTVKKIEKIIKKVRTILNAFPQYKEIMANKASITLVEGEDGLILSTIKFSSYDRIVVTDTLIMFHPEHGESKVILSYKSFDDLLSR